MFEPLKKMNSFTEDMFNRIIAFQEKEHPAWIEPLAFEERIKDLPLHYLIFSNGDRDPEHYAATVSPYYPLHHEILTLVHYMRQVSLQPDVLDLHGGNGFFGSLIAREGIQVTGLREADLKPNQIENFFDPERYTLIQGTPGNLAPDYDVIVSNWMPSNRNYTPTIVALKPKMIIYIYTEHTDEITGFRQTGTDEAFEPGSPYKLVDEWSVERPQNLLKDIWPDLTGNIQETRRVRVFVHEDYSMIKKYRHNGSTEPYDWEKELEMALLAHKAKDMVRSKGFPV